MSHHKNWSSGYYTVDLGFTQNELDIIDQKILENKIKNLRSHLSAKVRQIAKDNKDIEITNNIDCEKCLRKRNKFFIDKDIAPIIIQLAKNNCQTVPEYLKQTCIIPIITQ